MNTFQEAQAEALKARQAIDKLEAMKADAEKTLAEKRREFASFEDHSVETIDKLSSEIGEARRELQAALQRQSDAPIAVEIEATEAGTLEALTADQAAANAFIVAERGLSEAGDYAAGVVGYDG